MDVRPSVTCCQNASEDEIDADPDVFDCAACPVVQATADIWPENAQAWGIFQRLATRFVVDAGLAAQVFERVTADLSPDETADMLERLETIYDLVMPAKTDS